MRGIFITGTDTNIGKTFVSAILATLLLETEKICYWKPIQTGIETDDDTETVKGLANLTENEILNDGFRLEKPLSPHISARLANVEITVAKTLGFANKVIVDKFFIVEGAGGVFVPLNDNEFMIDLMVAIEMPVVIVARSGLGTINHSLLTIKTLKDYGLNVLGVVMNGEHNVENKSAIERYGKTKVLLEVPNFQTLNNDKIKRFLSSTPSFITDFYEQFSRT
ncbi:MAG: dethiobiotin synthase [Pyrinomonadaceae bacterium]|nr:dethiobiotin synthase [Pyrinomonadaceae bacterium]